MLIGLSLVDIEILNLMHLNRVSYMVRNPQLIFVFPLLGFSSVVPHHAFFQNTYNPEWGPVHLAFPADISGHSPFLVSLQGRDTLT